MKTIDSNVVKFELCFNFEFIKIVYRCLKVSSLHLGWFELIVIELVEYIIA